ncbi:MAG: hypothetical protein ACRCX2_20220 [Paraclostridium sp.]
MYSSNNTRIPNMELVEKVFLSNRSTLLLESPKVTKFKNMLSELDKEWFNFMPSEFFSAKYYEEQDELKVAFEHYIRFKKKHLGQHLDSNFSKIVDSVEYAMYGELSDVILSCSSAMFESKLGLNEVLKDIEDLKQHMENICEGYGISVTLDDINLEKLFNIHFNKIEELHYAKKVYLEIIYNQYENPWYPMLLKLYTDDELKDPSNKMKIFKEIRRMYFAIKNLGM